jgi:hypothetical protein
MKSLKTSFVAFVLAAVALGFVAHAEEDGKADRIVGTWNVTVKLVNCSTGQSLGSPFPSFLTFGTGGTLVETTANPLFFPSVRGPGHGIWSAEGGNGYRASSTAHITNNGVLVRTQTIVQDIEMSSPNEFVSNASIQFFDPSGALIQKGCATATAERYR